MKRIVLTALYSTLLVGCRNSLPPAVLTKTDETGKMSITLSDVAAACMARTAVRNLTQNGFTIGSASDALVIAQRPTAKDLSRDERTTYTFEQVGPNSRVTLSIFGVTDPDTASEKAEPILPSGTQEARFERAIKQVATECGVKYRL